MTVILYYVIPWKTGKDVVLVLSSLFFYAWGSIPALVLLLLSMGMNYAAGWEIRLWQEQSQQKRAKAALITAVALDLALLCCFKYTSARQTGMPLGISFYTFTALSYLLDIYWEKAEPEKNVLKFAIYISFFPKISQGPITEYAAFQKQLNRHPVTRGKLLSGIQLFCLGLFKKVLIADNLGAAMRGLLGEGNLAAAGAWLGMIFYSLQLFFDFAGYSDMAIGLGRIFGFRIDRNFNYPYLSDGVTDFWRRWHISLGQWFRDYVYIPLGGNRCAPGRQALNLSVVWLLTGIWHGTGWNYIFWGLYHGFWVLLDKFVLHKSLKRIPKGFRIFGTTLIACFGWIFFFCPSLKASFSWMGQMFGSAGLGFWNSTVSYYLVSNWLLLIVAILFCSPAPGKLFASLTSRRSGRGAVISGVIYLGLFLLCISGMIANTYSAFLYAQF